MDRLVEALSGLERLKGKSRPGHDEPEVLAYFLTHLREVLRNLDSHLTTIVDGPEKLSAAGMTDELDEIREELRHVLIMISLTETYSFLLPEEVR